MPLAPRLPEQPAPTPARLRVHTRVQARGSVWEHTCARLRFMHCSWRGGFIPKARCERGGWRRGGGRNVEPRGFSMAQAAEPVLMSPARTLPVSLFYPDASILIQEMSQKVPAPGPDLRTQRLGEQRGHVAGGRTPVHNPAGGTDRDPQTSRHHPELLCGPSRARVSQPTFDALGANILH